MGWVKGMGKGEWVKGMESALRLSLFVIPAGAGLAARPCVSCVWALCFWAQPGRRQVSRVTLRLIRRRMSGWFHSRQSCRSRR
jgi:hypothetical protein